MNDDFTQDPNAYFRNLQQLAAEQDRAKFAALAAEYRSTLQQLPKLREEIESLLVPGQMLDYGHLTENISPKLGQAAKLLFDVGELSSDIRNAAEMQAFVQKIKQSMDLQSAQHFTSQFQGICQGIRQRLTQEAADAKRRAKEKAETERKAREKAEAERRAREDAAQKMRVMEAKVKDAIPEMVVIPSGTFTMGCVGEEWETATETVWEKGWFGSVAKLVSKQKLRRANRDNVEGGGWDTEKPAHQVGVAHFSIGKYPVTFAQFDAFCDLAGFAKPADSGWGRGNRPVINVSWDDAQQYIRWLVEVTGKAYRLPSEAEWEYAARGGDDKQAFPWGQSADSARANYGGTVGKTTPVGQYPANGFGLYDMHGNVWEWCQDNWHDNYQGAPSTGVVWAGGNGSARVVRGGSWSRDGKACRSAYRSFNSPDFRDYYIGFRFALGQ